MKRTMLMLTIVVLAAQAAAAGEIGFIEDFSLAKERSEALKQLIPGTEDYYYYHCLHMQHTGQFDKVPELLTLWIDRHGRSARVIEVENRQALLTYQKDPKATLALIAQRLSLHFNHQREQLDKKPQLPTSLDAKLIGRQALAARALSRHPGNVDGFEDRAFYWLVQSSLTGQQRRSLLGRLARPDVPDLPAVVAADLDYRYSSGFGSLGIHRQMLLGQLEELLKLKSDLLNQTKFVYAYLAKLQPPPDVDWRHDPKEHAAYLDRLWDFVSKLSPAHNSLKAHVLYHRLILDRSQGVYDKKRFMDYIALPRAMDYVNPRYVSAAERRDYLADLNAQFAEATPMGCVGNDEPLVRSYLMHFFVEEDSYAPYETYIRDTYLAPVFAETKIVNGLGDMEKWYSMLTPQYYQALKERVDIDFDWTNKSYFRADEPVALKVHVKNVQSLIVKVYEINALNYYLANLREVDTDINLDGLVANEEKVYKYDHSPLRRHAEPFEPAALKAPGTYVVEFIGNGKASRAVIRKGKLRYLCRTSSAGQVFTILDESNRKLPKGSLWLAGKRHDADADGTIVIPFSTNPGRQSIILAGDGLATLDSFQHQPERYALSAGFYVDREALLKRGKAAVVIRPALHVSGAPAALSLLEEVKLTITSVDGEGVATAKEAAGFALSAEKESTYEFAVPENLRQISFALSAKVPNLSQGKKDDLSAGAAFALNQIDATEKVEDLHLSQIEDRYVLDVLGKTGERKADRPVNLEIKHRDFRDTVHVSLQTDPDGRIMLGELKDIAFVRATGPEGTQQTWQLRCDAHSYPSSLAGRAGEPVFVPYMGEAEKPVGEELSLLETRGGTFIADYLSSARIENGMLVLDDMPVGDYSLLLKDSNTAIVLRLAPGERRQGHVLAENRLLGLVNPAPLQIASVEADADSVRVRLVNASKLSRVHVTATRFVQAYNIFDLLNAVPFREGEIVWTPKNDSVYLAGRDIGEEYRYVIDRRYAAKFPGNMLTRPGLLLNPWALRKTETGEQVAAQGQALYRVGAAAAGRRSESYAAAARAQGPSDFANLDFLTEQAAVLTNLQADEKGVVVIPRKDLGGHQHLHVVAVDPLNTAYRHISLAEVPAATRDLRLGEKALDNQKHFTEQKQISVVRAGEKFVVGDISTSRLEAYDSLAKVHALYATLSSSADLREFAFLTGWNKLTDEQKREKYSKYACHELSFFVHRKDPEFFQAVVRPYLANKKDKTFMDRWLLGEDLSDYLRPWAHGRLNVAEKILLAQRIKGEQPATARHVKDRFDLIPPDIDRFNHLFKTALKGSALEVLRYAGDGGWFKDFEGQKLLTDEDQARPGVSYSGPARRVPGPAPAETPPPPAMPAKAKDDSAGKQLAERREAQAPAGETVLADAYWDGTEREDAKRRGDTRQFFRKLDKTEEWAENNYWHLPIERQNADLVTVNGFWKDYAAHDGAGPFLSANLAEASRNFTEMMLALAVLNLPFEAGKYEPAVKGVEYSLTAPSPMVIYHQQIKEARPAEDKTPILVSENFFRLNDRYRYVNNERLDKYVTDEFLIGVVYGAQVVITNPTSSPRKLDLLVQVPRGAMPVLNSLYTRGVHVRLEPYATQTLEYHFYFPLPGEFPHYPVHVAADGALIAFAEPTTLKAVEKLSRIDTTSWDYVSQHGSEQEVIDFLKANNVERLNLDRIAWRMRDKACFEQVTELLAARHAYNHTLWSYGVRHDVPAAVMEFLQHADGFVNECGLYIVSPLLTIDPVVRKSYQHLEYSPLVNARAHKLGKERKILNDRFYEQYMRLMKVLSYRPALDDEDLMSVTYYMLLQDRIDEGLESFARVDAARLPSRLQHDYFWAYTDFYKADLKDARAIASRYAEHPVERWRKLFANVSAQLDEIEGRLADKAPAVVDKDDRTQQQTALAASEPSFELSVEARKVVLKYQNVAEARVNYYLMDVELLFSGNPFVHEYAGQFSYIRPNATELVKLPPKATVHSFDLPESFRNANVMVEVEAGGIKKTQAYYANSLAVQVVENYGQVKISHEKTGGALAKVYVKVYARMGDGQVKFYKDGYTDLRGRFDYASLNTNEIENVRKFSILVLSETDGAAVREANPPKR